MFFGTYLAIYNMKRKRANLAGVSRLSPHGFRHTFVSDLLDAGADIITVRK
jgi:integrase